MSPFVGEGANLAMFDGSELGQAIAAHLDGKEAAIAEYGRAYFPRSAQIRGRLRQEPQAPFCRQHLSSDGLLKSLTGQELAE
jgi:2-polyprenyl-6-methoxyphenol hydroxylase-like FAD-dependent oxidoreductase